MLGEPATTPESHTAALTRAMVGRALRVIAQAIEEIDGQKQRQAEPPVV
jgi:hypothetical protein